MPRPFICAACRAQRLAAKHSNSFTSARREFYSSSSRRQDVRQNVNIEALFGLRPPRPHDRSKQPDDEHGMNTRLGSLGARGRYSGRELRPEELLNQLDMSPLPRGYGPSVTPTRLPSRNKRRIVEGHDTSTGQGAVTQLGKRDGNASPESAKVLRQFQTFARFVKARDIEQAWFTLLSIEQENSEASAGALIKAFRDNSFLETALAFNWDLISRWLESLQSESMSEKEDTVTPRRMLQAWLSSGHARSGLWLPALWQMSTSIHGLQQTEPPSSPAAIDSAIDQLMVIWKHCIRTKMMRKGSDTRPVDDESYIPLRSELDWSFLPSTSMFRDWQYERRSAQMFRDMLALMVPKPPSTRSGITFDSVGPALVTLDLLRTATTRDADGAMRPYASLAAYKPFVDLLENMLDAAPSPLLPTSLRQLMRTTKDSRKLERLETMALNLNLTRSDNVTGLARTPPDASLVQDEEFSDAHDTLAAETEPGTTMERTAPLNDNRGSTEQTKDQQIKRFASTNIKRLGRMMEKQNVNLLEQCKLDVFAFAKSQGHNVTALPLDLYEQLMLTCLSLRLPKSAIEVWNHVVNSKYELTAKTYTVMMRGAQVSRDFTGMEAFWRKMRSAGIQPDGHAWSTRIGGHVKLKRVKSGLQALHDMGQEWIAAAKTQYLKESHGLRKGQQTAAESHMADLLRQYPGPIDGVPRPDIVIVNSAIAALALNADREVPNVLAWGRLFDVKPDGYTYNALLNLLLRHGQPDKALDILLRMQTEGIKANSTTWTVILSALFQSGFLENLNHQQQQEKILGLIDSFTDQADGSDGLDQKGYALIIDGLLKRYSNHTAAAAILKHMVDHGKQPSAHIYTILMTSYFQQQPQPDFPAIEALWKHINTENSGYGAILDNVFYDRMIEGYSTHHWTQDLRRAVGFYGRMLQDGKQPGWRALQCLAVAFRDRGEWDHLRSLVDATRVRLRSARGGTQHTGQREFWNFIISTGVLSDEGITRPEHIAQKDRRQTELPLLSAQEKEFSSGPETVSTP